MKQTKIDWCDCTINPVVGCSNGCPYCYARKINDRFHFIENWNKPQFFAKKLKQLNSKKPKSIFMDSMSDVGLWQADWFKETLSAIKKNMQHNYIFLSKIPKGFINQHSKFLNGIMDNTFFGLSVTCANDLNKLKGTEFDFLSIEPLLGEITHIDLSGKIPLSVKQFIIGAETGNRKGKVIPQKIWVDKIVQWADEHNVRVFMKSSLKEIMGNDFRQDKLIWQIDKNKQKGEK